MRFKAKPDKLPCGAMGLSAICDCGIFLSYSLIIFDIKPDIMLSYNYR